MQAKWEKRDTAEPQPHWLLMRFNNEKQYSLKMSSHQTSIKSAIVLIALHRAVFLLFCPPRVYRHPVIGSFAPVFCSPARQIEIYETY